MPTSVKATRLNLATATTSGTAAIAAASMVAIFGTVLWRIATNAYGVTGDFLSFYAAGYLVRSSHASDLYDPATIEWAQRLLYPGDLDVAVGYPLPVFVAWLFAPLSMLPFTFSFYLWMGSTVALLAALLRLLGSELRQVPALPRCVFLVSAALAMPSVATIVFGQVDFIALGGLVAGYLLLRAKRPVLAGLPLCLVLVKPHFLAGVGLFLLARRQWKTIGTLAAVGLPLVVIPALLTAPETLVGNLRLIASYPGSDRELAVNAAVMPIRVAVARLRTEVDGSGSQPGTAGATSSGGSRHAASASVLSGSAVGRRSRRVLALHLLAEGVQGAMLNHPHCRHTLAHDLCHLRILQVLDKTKDDHLPLLSTQPHDRLPYPLSLRPPLEGLLWVTLAAAVHQGVRKLRALLARTQVTDPQVVSDPQQPGDEGRASHLVTTDRLPGLKERLRGQVLRLRRVAHHVVDVAIHANHVSVVERTEGLWVTRDGPPH